MKSYDATKKIDREWLLNWLLKWLLKNPVQFFRCDFMHRLFHKPLEILELQRGLVETRGDSSPTFWFPPRYTLWSVGMTDLYQSGNLVIHLLESLWQSPSQRSLLDFTWVPASIPIRDLFHRKQSLSILSGFVIWGRLVCYEIPTYHNILSLSPDHSLFGGNLEKVLWNKYKRNQKEIKR